MLDKITTIEEPAHLSYKDKETLDFQLLLDKNQYSNLNSLHICFPIRFRKLTNAAQNLADDLIIVNSLFSHGIKEINIRNTAQTNNLSPQLCLLKFTNTPRKSP